MAVSSDLAAVFSLIQQQQALEERKEERHQNLALNLLSMEMRETESARNVLIKEYYDKKTEMAATEEMYKKYEAMDPDFKTPGAMDLIQPIVKKDKIDMDAIIGNLDILTTRESELQAGLTTLESQGQKLKELQSEFWGVNKTLQPHEYYADPTDDVEQLQEYALKPVSEGGLGWDTTAGMDYVYSQMDPSEIEDMAYARGERLGEKMTEGALGSYAAVQSVIQPRVDTKGNVTQVDPEELAYVDPETGETVVPSDALILELQSMASQVDFDDFMSNFYAYEALQPETAGKIREVLEQNKMTSKSFFNLERDYTGLKSLENELAGIYTPEPTTPFEAFGESISGITDKEALFGEYKAATISLPPAEHPQFFELVEKQLGVSDAEKDYISWLKAPQPLPPGTKPPETVGEQAMTIPILGLLGWTAETINEQAYNMGVDIYNIGAVPLNYLTWLLTGYNPGYAGKKFMEQYATTTGLTEEKLEGFPGGLHDIIPAGGDIFGTPEGEFRGGSTLFQDIGRSLNRLQGVEENE
jgi:hypothetical protein